MSSCCYKQNTTHIHPFGHTHKREFLSHLNHLALCIIQSCFLGVNSIRFSLNYKYVITCASSCMNTTPSPFNSLSASRTSPLPMLIWGTSPQHPNKVHKYVETCHPSTENFQIFISNAKCPPIQFSYELILFQ
jgi:hypothetical protein